MGVDPSQKAADLFKAALARAPADRKEFLDQACRGNTALRADVESLLAADAQAEGFLVPPQRQALRARASEDSLDSLIGKKVGKYQVIGLIASGGMARFTRPSRSAPSGGWRLSS